MEILLLLVILLCAWLPGFGPFLLLGLIVLAPLCALYWLVSKFGPKNATRKETDYTFEIAGEGLMVVLGLALPFLGVPVVEDGMVGLPVMLVLGGFCAMWFSALGRPIREGENRVCDENDLRAMLNRVCEETECDENDLRETVNRVYNEPAEETEMARIKRVRARAAADAKRAGTRLHGGLTHTYWTDPKTGNTYLQNL